MLRGAGSSPFSLSLLQLDSVVEQLPKHGETLTRKVPLAATSPWEKLLFDSRASDLVTLLRDKCPALASAASSSWLTRAFHSHGGATLASSLLEANVVPDAKVGAMLLEGSPCLWKVLVKTSARADLVDQLLGSPVGKALAQPAIAAALEPGSEATTSRREPISLSLPLPLLPDSRHSRLPPPPSPLCLLADRPLAAILVWQATYERLLNGSHKLTVAAEAVDLLLEGGAHSTWSAMVCSTSSSTRTLVDELANKHPKLKTAQLEPSMVLKPLQASNHSGAYETALQLLKRGAKLDSTVALSLTKSLLTTKRAPSKPRNDQRSQQNMLAWFVHKRKRQSSSELFRLQLPPPPSQLAAFVIEPKHNDLVDTLLKGECV